MVAFVSAALPVVTALTASPAFSARRTLQHSTFVRPIRAAMPAQFDSRSRFLMQDAMSGDEFDAAPVENSFDDPLDDGFGPPPEESNFDAQPASLEDAKLFVGNLSWSTTDESLSEAFERHGTVVESKVIMDRFTGRSRGFGFIEYDDPSSAAEALNSMNGVVIDNRPIRVDRANKRPRRSPDSRPPRPRY